MQPAGLSLSVSREARPPYVQFERREVEDRTLSEAQGKYVARNVDFVLITPQGSKDVVEREVAVWFPYLVEQIRQGRIDPRWLEGWKHGYDLWLKGQEIPLNGTPVRTWVAATPAQQKLLISLNVLTVEDLSMANDETLARIGMGANELKRRAQDYLKEANGPGKVVAEVAAMRVELSNLKVRNDTLEAMNRELLARLNSIAPHLGSDASAVIPPSAPTRQEEPGDGSGITL